MPRLLRCPSELRVAPSIPALLVLGACTAPLDAELLDVQGIQPSRWSPGITVRIEGDGFLAGDEAQLTLEGELHRPGDTAVPLTVDWTARATSAELLLFRVTPDLVEQIGGRGTFQGSLRVAFATAASGPMPPPVDTVSGRLLHLELDLDPGSSAPRLDDEVARLRAAEALTERIGIRPSDTQAGTNGVLVEEVRVASPAGHAGIVEGDRIVRAQGVRVSTPSDVVVPEGAESLSLELERKGHAAPLRVLVPLEGPGTAARAASWAGSAVALAWLLLFLLFAPTAQLIPCAVASVGWKSTARAFRGLLAVPSSGSLVRKLAWGIINGVAVSLAFVVFPFVSRLFVGGPDVGVLALLAAVSHWLATTEVSTRRHRYAGHLLWEIVGGSCAVATILILSGALRLSGVVEAQGPLPWEWYAFRHPVGALAALAYVALLLRSRGNAATSSLTTQVAQRAALLLWVGLAVAIFLGGWTLPGISDPLSASPELRLLAVGLFCGKAWLLLLVAAAFGSSAAAGRRSKTQPWALPLAILSLLGAILTAAFPMPAPVEAVAGPVLFTGASVAALAVLATARRGRIAPRPLQLSESRRAP